MATQGPIASGLASLVPSWLSNRVNRNVGYRILWVIATFCDFLVQVCLEGLRAAWPGKGTPTALDLVAKSRGMFLGPAESYASASSRLQGWLTTWDNAGGDDVLASQIQAYVGGNGGVLPTVRIIDRLDRTTTIRPDGTIDRTGFVLDWDSVSNPERSGWWSDLWIIIYGYPTSWITYSSFSDPKWVAAWEAANTAGHYAYCLEPQIPLPYVSDIKNLVSTFKGAHTYIEAIVWCTDTTLFEPNVTNPANPDGTWGNWAWSATKAGPHNIARTLSTSGGTVRYWTPGGGL